MQYFMLDIFQDYFRRHGHMFEDAPDELLEGEHNLQFYSLFQDYLVLYEVRMLSPFKTKLSGYQIVKQRVGHLDRFPFDCTHPNI